MYPLDFDRVEWGHLLFIQRVHFLLSFMQTLSDYIPFSSYQQMYYGFGVLFICFQSLLLIGVSCYLVIVVHTIAERGEDFFPCLLHSARGKEEKVNPSHIYDFNPLVTGQGCSAVSEL